MDQNEDIEKWMAIESRALDSLRSAGKQWRGTGNFSQIFCFLIARFPSVATAYSLSERRKELDGYRFYCVRARWDCLYDREQFESSLRIKGNIQPTIDQVLVRLGDGFAQSVIEQIKHVSVPLFVYHDIQIDRTNHEFSNSRASLTWGERAPKEWRHIEEIVLNYGEHVDELAANPLSSK